MKNIIEQHIGHHIEIPHCDCHQPWVMDVPNGPKLHPKAYNAFFNRWVKVRQRGGDAAICEDWKTFSTFLAWYEHRAGLLADVTERLVVDKDILYPNNALYSPHTCLLVTNSLNVALQRPKPKPSGLPEGVFHKGPKFRYEMSRLDGRYELGKAVTTAEEAHRQYCEIKQADFTARALPELTRLEQLGLIPDGQSAIDIVTATSQARWPLHR